MYFKTLAKTLAEAQSDYAKTRKRNTIVFNESGFYIVGNEHSVFIPFFGITEISDIKYKQFFI